MARASRRHQRSGELRDTALTVGISYFAGASVSLSAPVIRAMLFPAVVFREWSVPLANVRTQLDGFTAGARQMTMSLFMEEGHFSPHLRRMRALYAAKRAKLIEGLAPLAARGWEWPNNPAGMHLLVRHARGDYVRAVAAVAKSLDLALLSSYRTARTRDDGLFLRFGALDSANLQAGIATLVSAEKKLNARVPADRFGME